MTSALPETRGHELPLTTKVMVLIGIFVAALVTANLLGTKITTLFGVSVSVAIFAYPLTFLVTDIIEEVYGRQIARRFILLGIVTLLLMLLLVLIATALPAAERYTSNEAYRTIFGQSTRMILASLVAFLLAQLHDVWAFAFLKVKTHGKALWLRNTLSTSISQLIDTVVFMFIAFYQVSDKFDVAFVISLIIPYWLFKVAFAIIDTPLVYAGVRWLRGGTTTEVQHG